MGAFGRLRRNLIHNAEAPQVFGGELQDARRFLLMIPIAPENGRTAFRRNDGIDGILHHDDLVADRNGQSAPAAALAVDYYDDGNRQLGNLFEVIGNGLSLAAFFSADAWISARGIHPGDDRL